MPRWHEDDGGRYLGTAHLVISRDIDEGWVNLGCYRVMVHDRDTLALYISPGKHGRIMRQKYFDQGKPFPVAISFGDDPLLLITAANHMPWGRSEYDYAGGIRGEPSTSFSANTRDCRFRHIRRSPSKAKSSPPNKNAKGPYGEWTGYYASGERTEPMLKVKRLMHRTNPIITGRAVFSPARRRRRWPDSLGFYLGLFGQSRSARRARRRLLSGTHSSPRSRSSSAIPATPGKPR